MAAPSSLLPTGELPPAYTYDDTSSDSKIADFVQEYGISPFFAGRLKHLLPYDIVFLGDDSTSMSTKVDIDKGSRWDELKQTINVIMKAALLFDSDGIDLAFLNRDNGQVHKNIQDTKAVEGLFREEPAGRTPLTTRISEIFNAYKTNEKPVLLVIGTDGEPTDSYRGASKMDGLRRLMDERESNPDLKGHIAISFVMCTQDQRTIAAYNSIDTRYSNVDCINDFANEKAEIVNREIREAFGYHDWIMKALLGPVCQDVDKLDERATDCCTIL